MPLVRGINLEFGVNRYTLLCYCCSITKLCLSLRSRGLQHAQLSCPSLSPGACSNSCLLSRWCHPTITSSIVLFSSHLQSFPASGSFPVSQLLASDGQSIGVSALVSVLPMNIQGWFPLGLTGLISALSKGLSRIFSSSKVWKHQFFSTQPSVWSNSHIHTWLSVPTESLFSILLFTLSGACFCVFLEAVFTPQQRLSAHSWIQASIPNLST